MLQLSPMQVIAQQYSTETMPGVTGGAISSCVPEFGRWQDVQRIFGIKRGTLYGLIEEGKIRSITLRKPGRKFGCRLIHLESVRAHLHALMARQGNSEVAR